jgi:hypothetical protein
MKLNILSLVFGVLALAGCTGQAVVASSAATIILKRPGEPPPADTKSQTPEHETWCYKTIADTECYARAQDVPPGRLVNVEPQNLRPLTSSAYKDELAGRRPSPATAKPVDLGSAKGDTSVEGPPVEEESFFKKITGYDFP